jgi:hypothetical protein
MGYWDRYPSGIKLIFPEHRCMLARLKLRTGVVQDLF